MRGKKKDSEFLSSFITECVQKDKDSPEDIIGEARCQIARIDEQIKEAERLKIIRSKLLDVVSTFDQTEKPNQSEEIRLLSFFKIQHPLISKYICDVLKKGNVSIETFYKRFLPADVIFCVKQLAELKIITKIGNGLLQGESFDEYLRFVLRDE